MNVTSLQTQLPDHAAGIAKEIDFELPDALSAHEPPEMRGIRRDAVRLLVSSSEGHVTHTRFRALPKFLSTGDVLVVNTSATIHAAIPATRVDGADAGEPIVLHLSTKLDEERWVVELRRPSDHGTIPLPDAEAAQQLILPGGGMATLVEPYRPPRLWIAMFALPDILSLAERYGRPIRYSYVHREWPLEYYQTIFADEPGSVEMPSAGRPFTRELLHDIARAGIRVAPVLLHTGVSSQESDEMPYPERFNVPAATAHAVNVAHATRHRVVAVGTTALRAIETAASPDGTVRPTSGWTDLVVTPERGVYTVGALITGFHPPRTSHLALLSALAGTQSVRHAYEAALRHRYLWHEFGDAHLLFAP